MAAMRDSNNSVDVLATTFTSMAGYVRNMGEVAREIKVLPESTSQVAALSGMTEQIGAMINQAVVSFQFYDKLVQRLSHVVHGLGDVSDLVGDRGRLFNPEEWLGLHQRFESKFSTKEERTLFEAVIQKGIPIEQALDDYIASLVEIGDEVELF